MKKRTMKELQDEAVEILRGQSSPASCGFIGEQLFREAPIHRGSAPFARIAGKVMKRLEVAGLARWTIRNDWGGWILTEKGKK